MFQPGNVTIAQMPVGPTHMYCEVHKDEEVKLYCKKCNVLVCSECVVDQHVGHSFLSLKDKAGETRKTIAKITDQIKGQTIPKVRETLEKVRHALKAHSDNGNAVVNGINKQSDELIKEINLVRNQLLKEEEIRQSTDKKKLEEFEKKMGVLCNAEKLIADCPHESKTAKDCIVIKYGLDLQRKVPEIEKEIDKFPNVKQCIFVPGKRKTESIIKLFGHCEQNNLNRKETSRSTLQKMDHVPEAKLEVQFKLSQGTHTGEIMTIATQENQSAWIATYGTKKVKQIDTTGRVNQTLELDTKIWAIAVTDAGLLVTPNGGSAGHEYKIKKVKPNGDIVTFVDMRPLRPRGICTTKTGHIYVGCVDEYSYDVTEKSIRPVVKMSSTGNVQHSFQYDNKGKRLFTQPVKLQENTNSDLWVRDRTAEKKGRVVVLQQDGKLRFVYTGIKNEKTPNNFYPNVLTAAGKGNMLISDTYNDIVHVVDKNGSLLQFLGSQQNTISQPSAISLDMKNRQLWIGDKNGQIQILNFTSSALR